MYEQRGSHLRFRPVFQQYSPTIITRYFNSMKTPINMKFMVHDCANFFLTKQCSWLWLVYEYRSCLSVKDYRFNVPSNNVKCDFKRVE